jgi:hypothetical protein
MEVFPNALTLQPTPNATKMLAILLSAARDGFAKTLTSGRVWRVKASAASRTVCKSNAFISDLTSHSLVRCVTEICVSAVGLWPRLLALCLKRYQHGFDPTKVPRCGILGDGTLVGGLLGVFP